VSMTTYPPRLSSAYWALASIFSQTRRPDAISLVLADDEFPRSVVPHRLRRFVDNGLNLIWTSENARSYNKLLTVLQDYPGHTVVTADDDALYPRWWLGELLRSHRQLPRAILGHRANLIVSSNRKAEPYVTWPRAGTSSPSSRVLLTGVGGILYPPGSLPALVQDRKLIRELCPTTDDIWFRAMSLLHGTTVAVITDEEHDFPAAPHAGASAKLMDTNVLQGENDRRLEAVFNHFDLWGKLEDGCEPDRVP